ncbi:cobalamin biosynthesis protein [Halolamina salina]
MSLLGPAGLSTAVAVVAAGVADALVGEPPTNVHPVAWFGRAVGAIDREWRHPRFVGLLAAIGLPLAVAGVVATVVKVGGLLHPAAAALAAAATLFVSLSRRMLREEAVAVVDASDDDLAAARERLPALVGRDPSALDAGEARSAAVESAAENLADGLVAPLLAFAVGAAVSLPAAAALAAWVKAVNTMDSMLGYRDEPTGWAPARLDDAVMFVPARLSAALLAIAAGRPGGLVAARRYARAPPSPNSGWPMAAAAAALGCRLHKPGGYDLFPERPLPDTETAADGVALVDRAGGLAFLLAAGWCGVLAGRLGGGAWL